MSKFLGHGVPAIKDIIEITFEMPDDDNKDHGGGVQGPWPAVEKYDNLRGNR